MSERPTLRRQLSALQAEVALRRKELDEDVRRGRAKPSERDYVIESLEAAIGTLQWLQRVEPVIKQRLFNDDRAPAGGCW